MLVLQNTKTLMAQEVSGNGNYNPNSFTADDSYSTSYFHTDNLQFHTSTPALGLNLYTTQE